MIVLVILSVGTLGVAYLYGHTTLSDAERKQIRLDVEREAKMDINEQTYPWAFPFYLYFYKPDLAKEVENRIYDREYSDAEKLGKKISGAFESFGDILKKGFETFGDLTLKGLEAAGNAIYKNALLPIKNAAESFGDRLKECGLMTSDSAELAGKETAYGVATAALQSAKLGVTTGLAATSGVVKGTMVAAGGVVEGTNQVTQGVLTGAGELTKGVLTAVEEVIKRILEAFDIEKLRYEGQLSDMEHGKFGNVQCTVKILGETENFNFDLDVHDPINSIKSIVSEIVSKCTDVIKKNVKI